MFIEYRHNPSWRRRRRSLTGWHLALACLVIPLVIPLVVGLMIWVGAIGP